MCSLFLTGFKRPLQDSDLWSLEEKSLSCNIVPRLHGEWDKELRKNHGWVSRDQSVGLLLSPFSLIHFNLILLVKVLYSYTVHVSNTDLHIQIPLIIVTDMYNTQRSPMFLKDLERNDCYNIQGSKSVVRLSSTSTCTVDCSAVQITLHSHLPSGQGPRQIVCQLKKKKVN